MMALGLWLDATRQRWKVNVLWVLTLATLVLMVAFIASIRAGERDAGMRLGLAFVGYSAGVWFPWLALAITCRACRRRVVWRLIRQADVSEWLSILLTAKACPLCGDQGRL